MEPAITKQLNALRTFFVPAQQAGRHTFRSHSPHEITDFFCVKVHNVITTESQKGDLQRRCGIKKLLPIKHPFRVKNV